MHQCILLSPQDIKILGWCTAEPVLPDKGEGASLALVGHLSSDGFTREIPSGVHALLH